MKKVIAVAAVGLMTLGLAACSSQDAAEAGKADISKSVVTLDDAWTQLEELNYSYSKVGDAEWMETTSPMLTQCGLETDQVQIFTTGQGAYQDSYTQEEVASELEKVLKKSGLTVTKDTTEATEGELSQMLIDLYASNEEDLNITLSVSDDGIILSSSYSKCVEGTVEDKWTAPGFIPVTTPQAPAEEEVTVTEGEAIEEVPVEQPAEVTPEG